MELAPFTLRIPTSLERSIAFAVERLNLEKIIGFQATVNSIPARKVVHGLLTNKVFLPSRR
jgi:hypothetical protein